jgi:hypothetical protein
MTINTPPFTWEERVAATEAIKDEAAPPPLHQTEDGRSHNHPNTTAIVSRFRDGAFGEMHSVSVGEYGQETLQSAHGDATGGVVSIDSATHFVNESVEWKERLEHLNQTSKRLDDMYQMGQEVQQRLTVMMIHQLRKDMEVHPKKAFRDSSAPLWQLCEEKLRLGSRDLKRDTANSDEEDG